VLRINPSISAVLPGKLKLAATHPSSFQIPPQIVLTEKKNGGIFGREHFGCNSALHSQKMNHA
jgi:hypothetical protein